MVNALTTRVSMLKQSEESLAHAEKHSVDDTDYYYSLSFLYCSKNLVF